MRFTLPSVFDLNALHFDTIIDVRAPSEFAEDHVPGALNLPVLSDAERSDVGTIFVQDSPFKARKLGAALVARNVAGHLETALIDKQGAWQPLVYCWRGGQRSGSFASILEQIGWRVQVLDGGYRSYRRAVVTALYENPLPFRFVLLDGNTGTAKTELLHLCAARGAQILDLEGLAHHRGSVLGVRPEGQPAQKGFESQLIRALAPFDPSRPVLVEAESSKVGNLLVPPQIWALMRAAPRITVKATLAQRASYLARTYRDVTADRALLDNLLDKLIPFVGRSRVELWHGMAAGEQFEPLARDLIEQHYDLRYNKGRPDSVSAGTLDIDLGLDGLEQAADQICAVLAANG